jgi:hypothetical protein
LACELAELAVDPRQWTRHPPVPPAQQPHRRRHQQGPDQRGVHHDRDDLPVEAVYLFTSAWTRLYGMAALEVFGHFQWALSDVEPFFETELALFLRQFGG